jgi:microcystin-dependent protein
MANTIKPKRSYTASNTPTLASGEVGVNAADGKIWIGNAAGNANVLVSSLALSDHTGTLTVAKGGTGLGTLTANNVILGNGTSTPTFVAPSTSGNVLTSNGTTWASTAPAASGSLPTGAIMPFAGASAPTGGYLLCDGSSVSSSIYLALHAVISNTYGGSAYNGSGGLNFNLPDLRGRLPMGAGTGTGLNASGTGLPSGSAQTARTRGQWLGEETHLLITSEMPSHSHTANTGSAGSHFHSFSRPAIIFNSPNGNFSVGTPAGSLHRFSDGDGVNDTDTAPNHQHTITAEGGGSRHATIPPVVILNYIIKT